MTKLKSILEISIKLLVLYSVGSYLIEVGTGTENSYESHSFFLWSERIVALALSLEYIARLGSLKNDPIKYILSPLGIIDLLSVLPFWLGFFVPLNWLSMIRTLRVLRLLKFFRYSRSLQFIALAFYRAAFQLKALSFPILVVMIFSVVAMYEAEHAAQPEAFKSMFDSLWFTAVTITTVGYGDISPITVLGKIVAMFTFMSALSLFAGVVGILGSALTKVIEEQTDAKNDPILLFREARVYFKN